MKQSLVSLVIGFSIFSGCTQINNRNYPQNQIKEAKEYRHPFESELRPGPLPYHEKMHQEKPEPKIRPFTPEEIKKHPSLWKRKLRSTYT